MGFDGFDGFDDFELYIEAGPDGSRTWGFPKLDDRNFMLSAGLRLFPKPKKKT
jgi:hypothetical protein